MARTLDFQSKIKEVYENPVGKDVLSKLVMHMGRSEELITNPIIRNLRLKTVAKLTHKFVGKGFYETFLQLLNEAEPSVKPTTTPIEEKWWKEKIVYQIYPRSFKDGNGDGIGDLKGITQKLDYLKELGIDVIWLSPIYDSPNDDNGYDIRDYYKIMQEFGTMADFDELLREVHRQDMKLIMDLVINHTSDEHEWYKKAISEPQSIYKDYYIFRKGKTQEGPPNNWTSYFSGSAWKYEESLEAWGLHLFSNKQMDLNWDNEGLRKEIYTMINWWLEKGIDGFRLDVINYISKREGLPEGNKELGEMMGYYGVEHYFYGPHLHEYLQEMRRETFDKYDVFTVGETPGVGMEMSKQLTAQERKELDMVFSFDQLEMPGRRRFEAYRYDLNYLKHYLIQWMKGYGNNCWMALFYENHDNPRMISKVDPSPEYRVVLGKLLAMLQLTLKGTPFIYQGQELGLVNNAFKKIDELKDIESLNLYEELVKSSNEKEAFSKVLSGSRDHARVPMPWNASKNGGFTTGTPWITRDEDYKNYNVETEIQDEDSVYHFYKKLIALRKQNKALIYGEVKIVDEKMKDLFMYYRSLNGECFFVECNLSNHCMKRIKRVKEYELVLSNYKLPYNVLRPYETNLYRL